MLLTQWDDLDARSAWWNATWRADHQHNTDCWLYEWVRLDRSTLSQRGGTPFVLALDDTQRGAGLLPLQMTPSRIRGIPMKVVRFSDQRPSRHGLLGSPFQSRRMIEQLANAMREQEVDMAILGGLPTSALTGMANDLNATGCRWLAARHTDGSGRPLEPGMQRADRCAIHTHLALDDYLGDRRPSVERRLRYAQRRALRHGPLRLERLANVSKPTSEGGRPPPPLAALLTAYREVDMNSWQWKAGAEKHIHQADHLRNRIHILSQHGVLDLAVLHLGDRPVAAYLGCVCNGWGTAFHLRYDGEFRQLSPGLLLLMKMLEDSRARGFTAIDLMGSSASYKHELATLVDSTYEILVFGTTTTARLLWIVRRALFPGHYHDVAQLGEGRPYRPPM